MSRSFWRQKKKKLTPNFNILKIFLFLCVKQVGVKFISLSLCIGLTFHDLVLRQDLSHLGYGVFPVIQQLSSANVIAEVDWSCKNWLKKSFKRELPLVIEILNDNGFAKGKMLKSSKLTCWVHKLHNHRRTGNGALVRCWGEAEIGPEMNNQWGVES